MDGTRGLVRSLRPCRWRKHHSAAKVTDRIVFRLGTGQEAMNARGKIVTSGLEQKVAKLTKEIMGRNDVALNQS